MTPMAAVRWHGWSKGILQQTPAWQRGDASIYTNQTREFGPLRRVDVCHNQTCTRTLQTVTRQQQSDKMRGKCAKGKDSQIKVPT